MSEITKVKDIGGTNKYRFVWLFAFAFIIFVYFFGLSIPLLGPDEPRYAQVAREMFDRGDWVTPTLGGFNWFEKPAMLYWLEIAAYKIFGVTEFAARIGPAIFGLGTIHCLWILGRFVEDGQRSSTEDQNSFTDLAKWLALVAASSLGIVVFSRGASFDIIVTFPIAASLVSFFAFDRRSGENFTAKYLPLISFYVFIGVALLAKGLIGIVFPFAIAFFYYLLSMRLPERAFIVSMFWGTAIAALVAATWYVPMYQRHGYQFIDEFFIQHHFQRFTSNKYQHPQPFFFYLWILPLMTIPWLPFFVLSLWHHARLAFRRLGASAEVGTQISPLVIFGFAWMLVPLVFFSVSGSKLPGYILPSVPGAVILAAVYVCKFVETRQRWYLPALALGVSTALVCLILLGTVVPGFANADSVKSLFAAANEKGFTTERVSSFFSTSHNAEYYAAGRLVRDESGKQKQFWVPAEIRNEIANGGGAPMLVLVPIEHKAALAADPLIRVDTIADNGELAITRVSLRLPNQP